MTRDDKAYMIARMAVTIAAGVLSDHENYREDVVGDSVATAVAIFEEVERVHGPIFEQENANS